MPTKPFQKQVILPEGFKGRKSFSFKDGNGKDRVVAQGQVFVCYTKILYDKLLANGLVDYRSSAVEKNVEGREVITDSKDEPSE